MEIEVGGERPVSFEDFFLRFPCDERAQEYLKASAPEVVEKALREFRPPREGDSDYSALLISFVRTLRGADLTSRLSGGGTAPPQEEELDTEALRQEVDEFLLRYPVDDAAMDFMLHCPPEVQHSVVQSFKPPREGDSDYSALLMSFAKRIRSARQQGAAGGAPEKSHRSAQLMQAELDQFMKRYPVDESAQKLLMACSPDVQKMVIQDFNPPRQGEADYSALLTHFTKRCRQQTGQRQSHYQQNHQQQGHHQQNHQQQNHQQQNNQQHIFEQFQQFQKQYHQMQHEQQSHQPRQPQPVQRSFNSGAALQQEVERFVRKYPVDESAYNYLVNCVPDVQWTVLKSFAPPRQGEQDYSALLTSFTKRVKQSGGVPGQSQAPVPQPQPLSSGGYRGPPSKLQRELTGFMQRYPLDESARNYLANSSTDVQWHILENFRPPREGEADYSALLIHFAKRCRQSAPAPVQPQEPMPTFGGWGNGSGSGGSGSGAYGSGGSDGGHQLQVDERRLEEEVQRFLQKVPMDENAADYFMCSTPEVQWTVTQDFQPNRPDSDYSRLVISFTKRVRQGQHALRPLPMVNSMSYGGQRRPAGAGSWAAPAPLRRGPPGASAAPRRSGGNGPVGIIPQSAAPEVQEFCRQFPMDEAAVNYLMHLPPDVQAVVINDFRPKVGDDSDYSALVISFSKRCRLLAAQRPGQGSGQDVQPGGDDSMELQDFRQRFPMDDRAFSSLQELVPEARRQVLESFAPRRMDDTDYSAPVMAYIKVCRARAAESAAHSALHQAAAPLEQQTLDDFCARYPMDARAYELLTAAPPVVARRVVEEFRPRSEGDADYSAAVVTFLGICKRSAMGAPGGGYGGPPSKRPRLY